MTANDQIGPLSCGGTRTEEALGKTDAVVTKNAHSARNLQKLVGNTCTLHIEAELKGKVDAMHKEIQCKMVDAHFK
jgi:hypothetical protein